MTTFYPPDSDPAPILQPEHIKSERTLKSKTKEQLVEYALMLIEDIRGEAESSYFWQRRHQNSEEGRIATAQGSQQVIDNLEKTVREQRAQINALAAHVVNLTGNRRGARDTVAPGASVYHDRSLQS